MQAKATGKVPTDTVCIFDPATALGSSAERVETLYPLVDRSVGRVATKTRLESRLTPGDPPVLEPVFTEVSLAQARQGPTEPSASSDPSGPSQLGRFPRQVCGSGNRHARGSEQQKLVSGASCEA